MGSGVVLANLDALSAGLRFVLQAEPTVFAAGKVEISILMSLGVGPCFRR